MAPSSPSLATLFYASFLEHTFGVKNCGISSIKYQQMSLVKWVFLFVLAGNTSVSCRNITVGHGFPAKMLDQSPNIERLHGEAKLARQASKCRFAFLKKKKKYKTSWAMCHSLDCWMNPTVQPGAAARCSSRAKLTESVFVQDSAIQRHSRTDTALLPSIHFFLVPSSGDLLSPFSFP